MGAKWSAVPVMALLLAVVAGCDDGAGASAEQTQPAGSRSAAQGTRHDAGPHPLFKKRLRDQFSAAHSVTEKTGAAHFVSSLVYGSANGDIVQRDEGDQDYTSQSASAERTFVMPAGHPESLLEDLYEDTRRSRQSLLVSDGDVLFRTSKGRWLRYSTTAGKEFGEAADEMLSHAGEAAPYSTPLTDLLAVLSAEKAPEVRPDGTRRYTEEITGDLVATLLPHPLRYAIEVGERDGEKTSAPLTVDVDPQGRVTGITADLDGVLPTLRKHTESHLPGIRTLRAEYTLSNFGKAIPAPAPVSDSVDDAEKLLVPLRAMKPGTCGISKDTGLQVVALARPVSCGRSHDLRVHGQVTFERAVDGGDADDADDIASTECGNKYGAMPSSWRADAVDDRYWFHQNELTRSASSAGISLEGDYTCYFLTS